MKSPFLALFLAPLLAVPLAAADAPPADAKPKAEAKNLQPSKNVTVDEAQKLIKDTPGLIVLDVRTPEEFEAGHIKGAVNVNLFGDFEEDVAKLDQSKPVLVHCAAGSRSAQAVKILQEKSKFPEIFHMNQGFSAWKKANKPVEGKALPKPERPSPADEHKTATKPVEKPAGKK